MIKPIYLSAYKVKLHGKAPPWGAFIISGSLYGQKTELQKQAFITKIMADRRISDLKLSDERETPT